MRRCRRIALLAMLALAWAAPAPAAVVDAVVAAVGATAVSASDIALARALGLFGLAPSGEPIRSGDVTRYGAALVAVLEASRLGIGPTLTELDEAWTALHEGLTIETPGATPQTPALESDFVVRNLLAPQQAVAVPFAMPSRP